MSDITFSILIILDTIFFFPLHICSQPKKSTVTHEDKNVKKVYCQYLNSTLYY